MGNLKAEPTVTVGHTGHLFAVAGLIFAGVVLPRGSVGFLVSYGVLVSQSDGYCPGGARKVTDVCRAVPAQPWRVVLLMLRD